MVSSESRQDENKFCRSHLNGPAEVRGVPNTWPATGTWVSSAMATASSLHQRDAPIEPVHEGRREQAEGQVNCHDEQDHLYRLTRLVEDGAGDVDEIRVSDCHCQRRVLGEI